MSIKILDTDCAINLFERIQNYDCRCYLQQYNTILTEDVLNELKKGKSFHPLPFEIYKFANSELELFSNLKT